MDSRYFMLVLDIKEVAFYLTFLTTAAILTTVDMVDWTKLRAWTMEFAGQKLTFIVHW